MKCPGQDTQFWKQDAIYETKCPECGHVMEFFKDDTTRKCPGCNKKIVNPKMDFGCASYCQFAKECLGTLPEEFVAKREELFKDRLAVEVKKYLGTDFKKISHTIKLAGFAEKIGKKENANLPVLLSAAYLYYIAGTNAPKKNNGLKNDSTIDCAKELMEKLGAKGALTNQVLDLVENREKGGFHDEKESLDRKVLMDAEMLTHMVKCEGKTSISENEMSARIEKLFQTGSGKNLARQTLLKEVR